MRRPSFFIVLFVTMLLAGCTYPMGGEPWPWRDDLIESSRNSSGAPAAFQDRDPLASCGQVVLDLGDTVPITALACLESAASGDGAELVVARPTTEGDPIITFYRVAPTIDGVDLFIDSSRDAFGSGDWTQDRCPAVPMIGEYGECSIEPLPNPARPGSDDE